MGSIRREVVRRYRTYVSKQLSRGIHAGRLEAAGERADLVPAGVGLTEVLGLEEAKVVRCIGALGEEEGDGDPLERLAKSCEEGKMLTGDLLRELVRDVQMIEPVEAYEQIAFSEELEAKLRLGGVQQRQRTSRGETKKEGGRISFEEALRDAEALERRRKELATAQLKDDRDPFRDAAWYFDLEKANPARLLVPRMRRSLKLRDKLEAMLAQASPKLVWNAVLRPMVLRYAVHLKLLLGLSSDLPKGMTVQKLYVSGVSEMLNASYAPGGVSTLQLGALSPARAVYPMATVRFDGVEGDVPLDMGAVSTCAPVRLKSIVDSEVKRFNDQLTDEQLRIRGGSEAATGPMLPPPVPPSSPTEPSSATQQGENPPSLLLE